MLQWYTAQNIPSATALGQPSLSEGLQNHFLDMPFQAHSILISSLKQTQLNYF
jgi:hypothetical protein